MALTRKRRRAPTDPIEATNRKTDDEFIREHLRPKDGWMIWEHPRSQSRYTLSFKSPSALTLEEFQGCYDLVDKTSGDDYRASAGGWHPTKKKAEMRSRELRYILVKNESGQLRGFTSLMPTYEDGQPVIYCYEIHLEEELHKTGLSTQLIGYLETIARSIPSVEKVMLSCFLCNERAIAFYKKNGFEKDGLSPEERKLRRGKVFVPDYMIMSKGLRRVSDEAPEPKS